MKFNSCIKCTTDYCENCEIKNQTIIRMNNIHLLSKNHNNNNNHFNTRNPYFVWWHMQREWCGMKTLTYNGE